MSRTSVAVSVTLCIFGVIVALNSPSVSCRVCMSSLPLPDNLGPALSNLLRSLFFIVTLFSVPTTFRQATCRQMKLCTKGGSATTLTDKEPHHLRHHPGFYLGPLHPNEVGSGRQEGKVRTPVHQARPVGLRQSTVWQCALCPFGSDFWAHCPLRPARILR